MKIRDFSFQNETKFLVNIVTEVLVKNNTFNLYSYFQVKLAEAKNLSDFIKNGSKQWEELLSISTDEYLNQLISFLNHLEVYPLSMATEFLYFKLLFSSTVEKLLQFTFLAYFRARKKF